MDFNSHLAMLSNGPVANIRQCIAKVLEGDIYRFLISVLLYNTIICDMLLFDVTLTKVYLII